jgi:GNAT superfamily N-acetyltransferase
VTGLDVRPYRPGDESGIVALFDRAFVRPAPPGFWAWKYAQGPVGIDTIVVLDAGGRVVAHMGGVPVFAQLRGQRVTIAQTTDLAVDPDYRRGLRGGRLLVELTDCYRDTSCAAGRAMLLAVPIPDALRLLLTRPRIDALRPFTALLRDLPISPGPRSWRLRVGEVALDDPGTDRLWARLARQFPMATIRGRAYLGWRYARRPVVRYRALGVFDRWRGRLEALAVLRPEWERQPFAVVMDWLAPRERPEVGRFLLAACEAEARAAGRSQLMAWFPPGSPEAGLLTSAGYAEWPTPYTLIVTLNSPLLSLPWVGAHWYYTVGDTDIL